MNEIIFMVEEPPEGGFAAEALGYPIFTVGDTLEELNAMVRDAVICHFDQGDRPKIIRLHFVREQPPLIFACQPIFLRSNLCGPHRNR